MSSKTLVSNLQKAIDEMVNSTVTYGDPIKGEKQTVIPISATTVMGGGGASQGKAEGKVREESEGGLGYGGIVRTHPVGYLQMKDGETEYFEIIDKNERFRLLAVLFGVMSFLLFRLLRRRS